MLFLQIASFLPFVAGRLAALVRRTARTKKPGEHAPLQGLLVKLD